MGSHVQICQITREAFFSHPTFHHGTRRYFPDSFAGVHNAHLFQLKHAQILRSSPLDLVSYSSCYRHSNL